MLDYFTLVMTLELGLAFLASFVPGGWLVYKVTTSIQRKLLGVDFFDMASLLPLTDVFETGTKVSLSTCQNDVMFYI